MGSDRGRDVSSPVAYGDPNSEPAYTKGLLIKGRGVAVIRDGPRLYAADMIDDADRDRLDLSSGRA